MQALQPTEFYGRITWLGRMLARTEPAIDAETQDQLTLGWGGIENGPYGGHTRSSCSRVTQQHAKGTKIANVRQLSIVSAEEMALTAAQIGLENIDPAWVGANIVIQGIPDFTFIPPSARLQAENGTCLVIDMENLPCHQPALTIARHHPEPARSYKAAAKGRRGVTAWVERPGTLQIGDLLRLHIPVQRAWSHS